MSINLKAITYCLGYQQISTLSSATGLTVPNINKAGTLVKVAIAIITPFGGDVRWRDDGVDPTISLGMPLGNGVTLQYDGDLSAIKFIEMGATAELNISFYA
jgi:hypothetical protein